MQLKTKVCVLCLRLSSASLSLPRRLPYPLLLLLVLVLVLLLSSILPQVLESSESAELIELCLEGFKKAVRIAGGLDVTVSPSSSPKVILCTRYRPRCFSPLTEKLKISLT